MTEPRTVIEVFASLIRDPREMLGRRWNYKSAVLSAAVRSVIFFTVNLSAGVGAASGAALAEVMFRLATSGFYGALTQAFRTAEPRWLATLSAVVLLPLVGHSMEFAVHWLRGTPALATSIGASITFTIISTAFNLFAMRHGVLVVGDGRQSIVEDLLAMPRIIALFIADVVRTMMRTAL